MDVIGTGYVGYRHPGNRGRNETMTSKYSVGSRMQWGHEHDVILSDHAVFDRWDGRMPNDSVSPEFAWEHSVDVSEVSHILNYNEEHKHNSARVYEGDGYVAVFLIVEESSGLDTVLTVLNSEQLDEKATREYLKWAARGESYDWE